MDEQGTITHALRNISKLQHEHHVCEGRKALLDNGKKQKIPIISLPGATDDITKRYLNPHNDRKKIDKLLIDLNLHIMDIEFEGLGKELSCLSKSIAHLKNELRTKVSERTFKLCINLLNATSQLEKKLIGESNDKMFGILKCAQSEQYGSAKFNEQWNESVSNIQSSINSSIEDTVTSILQDKPKIIPDKSITLATTPQVASNPAVTSEAISSISAQNPLIGNISYSMSDNDDIILTTCLEKLLEIDNSVKNSVKGSSVHAKLHSDVPLRLHDAKIDNSMTSKWNPSDNNAQMKKSTILQEARGNRNNNNRRPTPYNEKSTSFSHIPSNRHVSISSIHMSNSATHNNQYSSNNKASGNQYSRRNDNFNGDPRRRYNNPRNTNWY